MAFKMRFPFQKCRKVRCFYAVILALGIAFLLIMLLSEEVSSSFTIGEDTTSKFNPFVLRKTVTQLPIRNSKEKFTQKDLTTFHTYPKCKEKHDLVFLKTHKTGSSTIANILQRFGHSRKLNFALPKKTPGQVRYNYFGEIGGTLHKDGMIPSKRNNISYNILYNHVIFNVSAFDRVFKRSPTYSLVTILRDPYTQFQSAILYFIHQQELFKAATNNVTNYLTDPVKYEPDEPYISFTDNRQSLDLGVPPGRVRNLNYIRRYIKVLDRKFDLVMIMEKFDESLILLRRLMCWPIKDIIYIRKNTGYRNISFRLSAHDKKLHRKWSLSDHEIYNYFLKKFNRAMDRDHDNINEEVRHFKGILSLTKHFCSVSDRSRVRIADSQWNEEFYVTSLDCAYMRLDELSFLNKLLKRSSVQ